MPKINAPTVAEHRDQRRAALVHAGRDILASQGADAVTPAAVGAAAGIARSSVYQYFDSSVALLAAIVEESFPNATATLRDAVEVGRLPRRKDRGLRLRVARPRHEPGAPLLRRRHGGGAAPGLPRPGRRPAPRAVRAARRRTTRRGRARPRARREPRRRASHRRGPRRGRGLGRRGGAGRAARVHRPRRARRRRASRSGPARSEGSRPAIALRRYGLLRRPRSASDDACPAPTPGQAPDDAALAALLARTAHRRRRRHVAPAGPHVEPRRRLAPGERPLRPVLGQPRSPPGRRCSGSPSTPRSRTSPSRWTSSTSSGARRTFLPSSTTPIAVGAKTVFMQLGIANEDAAPSRARPASTLSRTAASRSSTGASHGMIVGMTAPAGYRLVDLPRERGDEMLEINSMGVRVRRETGTSGTPSSTTSRSIAVAPSRSTTPARGPVGTLAAVHSSFAFQMRVPGGGTVPTSGPHLGGRPPGPPPPRPPHRDDR